MTMRPAAGERIDYDEVPIDMHTPLLNGGGGGGGQRTLFAKCYLLFFSASWERVI